MLCAYQKLFNLTEITCKRLSTKCAPASVVGTNEDRKMGAWQIHAYSGIDELQYSDKVKIPTINTNNDVLVKIKASSVNPIDIAMTSKAIVIQCSLTF